MNGSRCFSDPGLDFLTVDRSLTAQLFQHLSSTGESITGFANGDVEDEFLDAELPHGVGGVFSLGLYRIELAKKILKSSIESKMIGLQ